MAEIHTLYRHLARDFRRQLLLRREFSRIRCPISVKASAEQLNDNSIPAAVNQNRSPWFRLLILARYKKGVTHKKVTWRYTALFDRFGWNNATDCRLIGQNE